MIKNNLLHQTTSISPNINYIILLPHKYFYEMWALAKTLSQYTLKRYICNKKEKETEKNYKIIIQSSIKCILIPRISMENLLFIKQLPNNQIFQTIMQI